MGRIFGIVLIVGLLSAASASAQAENTSTCLSSQDVQSMQKDFRFETWDDITKKWILLPSVELCDRSQFSFRVFEAMLSLKKLPPLAAIPGALAIDTLGASPIAFVKDRVKTIRLDTTTEMPNCRGGTLAYVAARKSQTIHLCPVIVALSELILASTVVHEARHLDSPSDVNLVYPATETVAHPHGRCTRGSYLKMDVCDEDYSVGGSYGVQTEFFIKIAKTSSIPSHIKKEARALAIVNLIERFNTLPFQIQDGVLIVTEAGAVNFYSGADRPMIELIPNVAESSVIALRNIPVIFDAADASVKSQLGPEPLMDTPGVFAVAYRKHLSQSQREGLLDAYFGAFQACYLFTKSLYCEVGSESVSMPLPEGFKPLHFAILPLYGRDSVFIVSDQGDLHSLPFNRPTAEWKLETFEINKTLTKFKAVALVSGEFNVGIDTNGRLVHFKKVTERSLVPGLENQRFKKIIAPFSWSKELQEL